MTEPNLSPFLDLNIWPNLKQRHGDVIIATYAKFGHLRMQYIVANILARAENLDVNNMNLPWVELRHSNSAEKTQAIDDLVFPRVLRTHLKAPEVYRKTGKYIYVGRDPRDLVWNLFRFHLAIDEDWRAYFANFGFSQVQPGLTFDKYWEIWINGDGAPFWSYFDRLKTWWDVRDEGNVLFVHYLDFKTDMESAIRKICDFLHLSFSQEEWSDLMESCKFNKVTKTSEQENPLHSAFWNGGLTQISEVTELKPQINWKAHLNFGHQAELERELETWIGKAGKSWVMSGRHIG